MKKTSGARDIVVVAASLGGLLALKKIMSLLPSDLPASVFVVMHIGALPSVLPEILQADCPLPVMHACDGQPIAPSTVYVAPPDRHMLMRDGLIILSTGPKENFARPAADPLFRSAAVEYGPRAIGVILTGRLDGAAGLKAVDACGGFTIVQEPSSCVAPDMPKAALQAVSPNRVVPIEDIAAAIVGALTDDSRKGVSMDERERIALETKIALTGISSPGDLERLGHRSSMTCPDCGGVAWRIGDDLPLRYRCHTGHAFSALSLESEQRSGAENALWSAVRRLEESLLLIEEQLSLGEAARSPGTTELRARKERLQAAIEETRQLALDSSTSPSEKAV
ncbi:MULTISPECIES: chemotaxis protein CheB [Paraburkholderia]|uniref:protein-glutamate methylesterase n=1 Tax=Paraburkholderia podalyriae TaxID=1938811 RepID=A0ABR7PZT6_9BURK|nr:chemotaxis protein CheB [Paraburkholderia podalyriae]MBC8751799.1 chemotaxis protein CheB [Paraburkholderia podalyriae]